MFGNYVVDHGTYKLTIQNLIIVLLEAVPLSDLVPCWTGKCPAR